MTSTRTLRTRVLVHALLARQNKKQKTTPFRFAKRGCFLLPGLYNEYSIKTEVFFIKTTPKKAKGKGSRPLKALGGNQFAPHKKRKSGVIAISGGYPVGGPPPTYATLRAVEKMHKQISTLPDPDEVIDEAAILEQKSKGK